MKEDRQNTKHDFQNTVLNSQWHCLRQMPQKSCIVFFTKQKEVDPIKFISLRQISVSIELKL